MNRLRGLAILMGVVILVVTGFQVYWLRDNYKREATTVEARANGLFRETVRNMQDSLLQKRLSEVIVTGRGSFNFKRDKAAVSSRKSILQRNGAARFINVLSQTLKLDTANKKAPTGGLLIRIRDNGKGDSLNSHNINLDSLNPESIREVAVIKGLSPRPPVMINMNIDSLNVTGLRKMHNKATISQTISTTTTRDSNSRVMQAIPANTIYFNDDKGGKIVLKVDSLLNDSIPLKSLHAEFSRVLQHEKLELPFTVERQPVDSTIEKSFFAPQMGNEPSAYKLQLGSASSFLLKRISLPILFSIFLVSITILSFVLLYRSLIRQHRLAQMKNDLISNITHELKTPIATVGVAIEALKNFNAMNDPQRTKEYLDISQSELQRLGLLVDKVLKLSMFENKKIIIKPELFDLAEVVNEVVTSLRLQAEKFQARINVTGEGDMTMEGDRLHLLSVVFNLLDNAMKYSKANASIQVEIKGLEDSVVLKITDNGIGIAPAYQEKIFEKFFRVPTGDTHNAKGHGLGLSYVAQVIRQHNGTIELSSQEGIGSIFTVTLPKHSA